MTSLSPSAGFSGLGFRPWIESVEIEKESVQKSSH